MIKSERKIRAIINNARCFLSIREEFASFDAYLWSYSSGKTILYMGHQKGNIPARNGLSDKISRDLKKRGFQYLGPVVVYSHLQACGIINDHTEDCFRFHYINEHFQTVRKRRDKEK
jgi:DNA-3-methyladenine glycosylase I